LYLGQAKNTILIPRDLTKRDQDVLVRSGDHLTIEAWSSGQLNGVRKLARDTRKYKVLRPASYDGVIG
jgi:hypothetical protein